MELSVCIATYNRRDLLKKRIQELLREKENDFLIEITDNDSDDGTIEMLKGFESPRILIHKNDKNIGAMNNIVKSIFNCTSKYALYVHDRDIIDTTKILELIRILKCNNDVGIVISSRKKSKKTPTFNIIKYDSGAQSIANFDLERHPSGIAYNLDYLKGLCEQDYLKKSYDLMVLWGDILKRSRLLCYDNGLWDEMPVKEKQKFISRSEFKNNGNLKSLYIYPIHRIREDIKFIDLIIKGKHKELVLDSNDVEVVIKGAIGCYIDKAFSVYKSAMFGECRRYGVRPKLVTITEMVHIFLEVDKIITRYLYQYDIESRLIQWWKKKKIREYTRLLSLSLKLDLAYLKNRKLYLMK